MKVTKLKYERLMADLTQYALAKKTGVYQQQISPIERGFVTSRIALTKMARHFGLTPEEALEEVEVDELEITG